VYYFFSGELGEINADGGEGEGEQDFLGKVKIIAKKKRVTVSKRKGGQECAVRLKKSP